MKRWWGRWLVVGLTAMGSTALAQAPPAEEPRPSALEKKELLPQQMDELNRLMLASDEQGFLGQLHEFNQMEIALGEQAHQKALSPQVKQYGERLVEDHEAADQKVLEYAKQRGFTLGPVRPANDVQRRLQSAQMATKARLTTLLGPVYEQQFLATMLGDHDEVIHLVTIGRQRFPKLAPLVDGLLPVLQAHRDRAYQLLGQVPREAQQPQARPPAGERR